MKKKIGISFSRTNFQNYWNWFSDEELKNDVELVELSFEKSNEADIPSCDGFILTGGVDVLPEFYSGSENYAGRPDQFQAARDRFEEKIYRFAQKERRPLLGICRGLQLVNVLEGGSLIQDLGEGNIIHKKITEDKEHRIMIEPGTLLHEITGSSSGIVNSAHHQAIDPDGLGKNLKVNAVSNDGEKVIEGIEFDDKTNKGFMLCVQWHPERMKEKQNSVLSFSLKKRFLKEIQK